MAAQAWSDDPEQSDVSSAAVFTAQQCAVAQGSTGTCTAALVANLGYITSQAQLQVHPAVGCWTGLACWRLLPC
jgi:hypothetical protein